MQNKSIFYVMCGRGKSVILSAILLTMLTCSGCDDPLFGDDNKKNVEDIKQTHVDTKVIESVKMNPEEIYEKIGLSVVNIKAMRDDGSGASGAGVIFTDDGYIITNDHVIRGRTSSMEVYLADKRLFKAKLIATDPRMDLAVIKIEGNDLQTVKFGDSDKVKKGSVVVAIGNPYGLEDTLTAGRISNLNRDVSEELNTIRCLQMDASINPGSSGGALLNEYGELIGINVMGATKAENIGFAIPSNDVKKIVEQLKDKGYVPYPYLGVDAINQKTDKGVSFILVRNVRDDSPAAKAGLKKGDIIFRINDARVENVPKLREQINGNMIGSRVSVYIMRSNDEGIIEVTLEEIPKGYSSIDWS